MWEEGQGGGRECGGEGSIGGGAVRNCGCWWALRFTSKPSSHSKSTCISLYLVAAVGRERMEAGCPIKLSFFPCT